MFDNCFKKLESIAGPISRAERKALQDGYEQLYLEEARSGDLTAAGAIQSAFNRLAAEAEAKKARAIYLGNLNAVRKISVNNLAEQVAKNTGGGKIDALSRLLAHHPDTRTGFTSVEGISDIIYQSHSAALVRIANAIGSKMGGIMQRGDKVEIFTRHVLGEKFDGSEYPDVTPAELDALRSAGDEWAAIAEVQRTRTNKSGGNIGKLDGWGYPQSWDAYRTTKICQKLNKKNPSQAFVDIMKPMMSRSKMVDAMGASLSDEALEGLLRESYLSIATEGANKERPSGGVGSSLANKGSRERVLHFNSAKEMLAVQSRFGGHQLLEVLDNHVRASSNQIAMMEFGGPSVRSNIEKLISKYQAEEGKKGIVPGMGSAIKVAQIHAQLNLLAGTSSTVDRVNTHRYMQGLRNLEIMKLAGAAIASLTGDPVQYRSQMILHSWDQNLPLMKRLQYVVQKQAELTSEVSKALISRGYRDAVANMGLAAEAMNQVLYRNGEDMANSGWTNAVPAVVMKMSLFGHLTNSRRAGMRVMTLLGVTDKLKYDFDNLGEIDSKIIGGSGITKEHWEIFKLAEREVLGNKKIITPHSIMKIEGVNIEKLRSASEALGSFMLTEDKLNVLEPSLRIRAQKLAGLHGGMVHKGTIRDELAMNFYQFKAFPHAFMSSYFNRAQMFDTKAGKTAYIASMIVASTVAGAVTNQVWNLLSGRDIESMEPEENPGFYGRALMRGGGLSFYGDFLQSDVTWKGQVDVQGIALGPAGGTLALFAGDALIAYQFAEKLSADTARGEEFDDEKMQKLIDRQIDSHVRDAKSMLPTNLWYTRALTDRLIFNQIGEFLRPGAIERMEERTKGTMGTEYFWSPSNAGEIRAPGIGGESGTQ